MKQALLKAASSWRWLGLLPVIALIVSLCLFIYAARLHGVQITIKFANGYGLKPNDSLQYRGIVVGRVESVVLNDNAMDHVQVTVRLTPEAQSLARQNSKFWIVRPRLDIHGAMGLETLLGAKYIAVLPGDGAATSTFVGLEEPVLTDMLEIGGLELVLQATTRGGLTKGAPINYRQITIGSVFAVGLASDASAVEIRAYIKPAYRQLIRENTVFWRKKALSVQAGLTQLSVELDSLQSLVSGGISLAIPKDYAALAATGHRFILHDQQEEEWLEWKPVLQFQNRNDQIETLLAIPKKGVLNWTEKRMIFFASERSIKGWFIPFQNYLLAPSNLLKKQDGEAQRSLFIDDKNMMIDAMGDKRSKWIGSIPYSGPAPYWPATAIRVATIPEDVYILGGQPISSQSISAARLQHDDQFWKFHDQHAFDENWHGAAVVAAKDNYLVGLLWIEEGANPKVVLLNQKIQ